MNIKANTGDWVQISGVILEPDERPLGLPEVTRAVPLEFRQRGFLRQDARVGEEVEIETVIGRRIRGKLVEINPAYEHSFGEPVPGLLKIGPELKRILEEGDSK